MNDIEYHVLGSRARLRDGEAQRVVAGERELAPYRIGGEVFATDDACTHAWGSRSEGCVEGDEVECPLHGGRVDVRTGKATAPPATEDLDTCEVRIERDNVLIGIPS